VLPNFLICGAAKAGTTSLYHLLRRHQHIYMPVMKEPHYFVRQSIGSRIQQHIDNMEDYEALFAAAGPAQWRGEASVFYLYYYAEAIPNIIAALGRDVRIIIVLRNPVERAFSAYLYAAMFNARETLTFEEALDLEAARMSDPCCSPMLFYKSVGFYNAMVTAFRTAFPRVGIYLFDDLLADPEMFAQQLFGFLDLTVPAGIDFRERANVGGREWIRPGIGNFLKSLASKSVRQAGKRIAPETYRSVRSALTGRFMRPAPRLRQETRAGLVQVFGDEVYRLSDTLGRDVTHWLRGG